MGIDPSLTNTGLCLIQSEEGFCPEVLDLVLVETTPAPKKSYRHVSHDDLYRLRKIRAEINRMQEKADFVAVELPGSNTQSARSGWALGACVGLMSIIYKPLILVTPKQVKQVVSSEAKVSKERVVAWAYDLYPDAPWLRTVSKGVPRLLSKNEHLADSIAVVHAARELPEFHVLAEEFK